MLAGSLMLLHLEFPIHLLLTHLTVVLLPFPNSFSYFNFGEFLKLILREATQN